VTTVTQEERDCPLCVDLDGTLVATDLLWETVLEMLRSRPHDALRLPLWLLGGRAQFKRRITDLIDFDVALLPYRAEVLDFLREQKEAGRRIVLVTAADERVARAVAQYLRLFDEVIASDGQSNLKGEEKLRAIRERLGTERFDYLGDSTADLPLWQSAERALLVCPNRRLLASASRVCSPFRVFESPTPHGKIKEILRVMRPHQWAKNVLLLVPLMTAHRWFDPAALIQILLAFIAFSLAASSVYILNDLLDLQSDRKHPSKRFRPLASGHLPIPTGFGVAAALLGLSLGLATALPWAFDGLLLTYVVVTTAYSAYFKRRLLIDVLCLAGLYTLRILAGGAATGIVISPWLMAFSMFFFLSMAFAKRYTELSVMRGTEGKIPGRGYRVSDLEMIRSVGPASGYLCVVVFSLYISSPDVLRLYTRPTMLWLFCPILLYWILRVWFLAHRQELPHDPVLFALQDRQSYLAGLLFALIQLVAI
jgi:HAD superfamily hydrolase (TIGR01549 family)